MIRRASIVLATAIVSTLVAALSARTIEAQSAQKFSVQLSGLSASNAGGSFNPDLGVQPDSGTPAGFGFEAQARLTPGGLWSIGIGYQHSSRKFNLPVSSYKGTFTLTGIFVEPRFTFDLGSNRLAPYLAGRVARVSRLEDAVSGDTGVYKLKSPGYTFGGGGGLLFRVTSRLNADFGAAIVRTSMDVAGFGSRKNKVSATGFVLKGGISVGF